MRGVRSRSWSRRSYHVDELERLGAGHGDDFLKKTRASCNDSDADERERRGEDDVAAMIEELTQRRAQLVPSGMFAIDSIEGLVQEEEQSDR